MIDIDSLILRLLVGYFYFGKLIGVFILVFLDKDFDVKILL